MRAKDSALVEEFHASFRIEDRRSVVSLPKQHGVVLPNRMNTAIRLSNLRKGHDNEALMEIYYAQMVDYIAKGQVEIAPLGRLDNSALPTTSGDEESEAWEG
jgi:hypothetical protein